MVSQDIKTEKYMALYFVSKLSPLIYCSSYIDVISVKLTKFLSNYKIPESLTKYVNMSRRYSFQKSGDMNHENKKTMYQNVSQSIKKAHVMVYLCLDI